MLKRIWCWLFHWKYRHSDVIDQSVVRQWCDKCRREWYEELK